MLEVWRGIGFWTLLFLGPLLELGAGLLIARVDRRYALALVWFLPLFFVSIALCTKAWVDGVAGRPYSWVKTRRWCLCTRMAKACWSPC